MEIFVVFDTETWTSPWRKPKTDSMEPHDPMKFCINNHAKITMLNFNQMRNENVLVDVVLVVGRKEFPAHRALLASYSEYFRAMFTSNTVEAQQRSIELRNLRPNGVSAILDFMYTSEMELTIHNVQDVFSAASYIQMDKVTTMCVKFLTNNVTDENFVDLLNLAKLYSHGLLMKFVLLYIGNDLLRLSKTSEFQRLTDIQIREVLSGEFPIMFDELEVLGVLLRWYRTRCADAEEETENMLALIINTIRFNMFTLPELTNFCEGDEFRGLKIAEPKLWDHMVAANGGGQTLRESSPSAEEKWSNYRGLERAFVMVGGNAYPIYKTKELKIGFFEELFTNANKQIDQTVHSCQVLTERPEYECIGYGYAVLHNKLYVVGGFYLPNEVHSRGYCYCPITDEWTKIADMTCERCGHTVNAIAGNLMAVGGEEHKQSCEVYDPTSNEWRSLEALPEYKRHHASAVIGNMLYVSGGMDRDGVPSATLWCFNWTTQRWKLLPPMQYARVKHSMVAIAGKLYVLSGVRHFRNGYSDDADTIECFDNNGWRTVTTQRSLVCAYGAVVDGTRLVIFGDHFKDHRSQSNISWYDVVNNTWSDNYFIDNMDYRAFAAMYVPRYLGTAKRNFDSLN